jgi:hypothetical protein
MPLGIDNSWDHEEFTQQFKIEIKELKDDYMEFDMIGVDPAIANALRRILIAEVPTVAIEHVFIINNTSIIQVRAPSSAACRFPARWKRSISSDQRRPACATVKLPVRPGPNLHSSRYSRRLHPGRRQHPRRVLRSRPARPNLTPAPCPTPQDEVMAHRLGLVPLLVDPAKVDFKSREEAPSEKNTLVFKLNVHCRWRGRRGRAGGGG